MKTLRDYGVHIVLSLVALGVACLMYARMPDPVAIHWNIRGEVDGQLTKPWGAVLMPAINAMTVALLIILGRRRPGGEQAQAAYQKTSIMTTVLLTMISTLIAFAQAGLPIAVVRVVPVLVGLMLIVTGNYLPKFARNRYVGIRTPWSLRDEGVWFQTHRFGGKWFVAGGVAMIMLVAADAPLAPHLAVVLAIVIAPIAYSWWAYRQLVSH